MRDIIITSSFLILAILSIRYLAKGKMNPILQYALWLPVVLRLCLPIPLWNSHISILNLLPDHLIHNEAAEDSNQKKNLINFSDAAIDNTNTAAQQPDAGKADTQITGIGTDTFTQDGYHFFAAPTQREEAEQGSCLPFLWGIGVLFVGGYMFLYQIKWKRYLRKNRKVWNGGEKYRGVLSVYTVEGLPSPCLSGRSIYLTEEMAAEEKQLAHILAHEYCHYKHLDFVWVIVRCVLAAIYWFHPLVWAAAYASKQDSELACDEAAIRLLGEKERIAYGKTLLLLIAGERYSKNRVGIVSAMSGGEKGIKERISLIARKYKYMTMVSVAVILIMSAFVIVSFSGKAQEDNSGQETDISSEDGSRAAAEGQDMEQLRSGAQKTGQTQNELENVSSGIEEAARTEAILAKLDSYDADIAALGSREGVYGIRNARNPADYVQAYADKGAEALEEGMYLLETLKGSDASDIRTYGMYSKEYGCMGIKIIIGDDCNNFAEPWLPSFGYGMEGNLSLYDSAEDGMPKTFAMKIPYKNTSDSEIWNVYLCDRYDTGTIALRQFEPQEYLAQIEERLDFEILQSEGKINVYDSDEKIGEIAIGSDVTAMKEIKEVVIDGSVAGWELGNKQDELKLFIAIGLKLDEDLVWYRNLNFISFPVTCGDFGDRTFTLGHAKVEPYLINKMIQDFLETAFSEDAHYDVELLFKNPCPDYTRISDEFGVRIHPVTGEKREHNGVDLAAPGGADVLAAAEGTVYRTGYDITNGNFVVLYHVLSGEFTYYTHCQDILVAKGEQVSQGQKIATVGSTGMSTGAHLHFALSRDGEYVEPVFE